MNDVAISNLATTLKSLPLAPGYAEALAPRFGGTAEAGLRASLWAASICHSTKGGLTGRFGGTLYKGWDFLIRAFGALANDFEHSLEPTAMSAINAEGLRGLLTRSAGDPLITLVDLDRRAAILNESARELTALFEGSVSTLLETAHHSVGGPTGVYAQLERIRAFADPLRKKSTAFLMTIHFAGLWTMCDHENVEPMIDYHRMRLFCRTGCISVADPGLLCDLVGRRTVAATVERSLRVAAAGVCKRLVVLTGMSMFECDNLIWAHARSCCRHRPVCTGGALEDSSFYALLSRQFHGRCEFQDWCVGFQDATIRAIWEPEAETELY